MAISPAQYRSPLEERYASAAMLRLFSAEWKHQTWRRLWLYLAEAQRELGLPIKAAALNEMRKQLHNIDWARVRQYERKMRHDVMAHIHAFGDAAPQARGIIHLGATSAYVVDNADLIQLRAALLLIKSKLLDVMEQLRTQARKYKNLATLGYTHFQPAQPTTVGKRFTLYLQEMLLDLEELEVIIEQLPLRGAKGATGTQASFLTLFNGDHQKVRRLDAAIAKKCGFKRVLRISGQTSSRKLDYRVVAWLAALAQTASKFACDLRLWQHKKEVEEPFETNQVGSSAMPFKRNPMRAERINALARFVMALPASCAATAATQWFERSLDDSANRRLVVPEAFLAIDGILELLRELTARLEVHPRMIAANLNRELPFMGLEALMLRAVVEHNGDRQALHAVTRELAFELNTKLENNTAQTPAQLLAELKPVLMKKYALSETAVTTALEIACMTGRSKEQVDEFIAEELNPALVSAQRTLSAYKKHHAAELSSLAKSDVRV